MDKGNITINENVVEREIIPTYCAVCNKNVTNMETGITYSGMSIQTYTSPKEDEFISKQLGPYEVGKTYNICVECLLKSLGVKP